MKNESSESNAPLLLAIMGPTASGKTELAEELADVLEAELINADAFQVYRGMDIGTGKPTNRDRYHLVDIRDPDEPYGVGEFCRRSLAVLERLWSLAKNSIVVGGTGLYIRSLFEQYDGLRPNPPAELRSALQEELHRDGLGPMRQRLLDLDPSAAQEVDLKNPLRVTRALERLLDDRPSLEIKLPPFQRLKIGIDVERDALNARIESRVRGMVQNGWVEEVKRLLDQGYGPENPGFRAIGYIPLAESLLGQTELEEATAATIAETRRYAKRQRTWLRSEPGLIHLKSGEGERLKESLDILRSTWQ
jgi:tRNA dimethylallyltransferase